MKTAAAAGASLALPAQAIAQSLAAEPAELPPAFQPQTRGIGIYPGAPTEYVGPTLVPAAPTYRNLALHRPAYHSSSYDFNLTAQLVTDGIIDTEPPQWTSVSVDGRVLGKDERELLFDHFLMSSLDVSGTHKVIDLHLGGGNAAPRIDRMRLVVLVPDRLKLAALTFRISASMDGHLWRQVAEAGAPEPHLPEGYGPDFGRGAYTLAPLAIFPTPMQSRFYRVELIYLPDPAQHISVQWKLAQLELYEGATRVEVGGPYRFTSAWKSAGLATEWVYVDLGVACNFDRVALHWIAPPSEGVLQVSDDAAVWRDVQPLAAKLEDDRHLAQPVHARYVRALMTTPATAEGYVLSEFEVFGKGGLLPHPAPQHGADGDGWMPISGGQWRVQRANPALRGDALSLPAAARDAGIVATVPGTVLTSYLSAGAIPDPNYGDNQLHISDSYFYADFWYTTSFTAPSSGRLGYTWLEFGGVNWNAEVYLNGESLGRIEGGFQTKRFAVTGKLHAGTNGLAVRVEKNATPGSAKQKSYDEVGRNGGALGSDNPTYHASAGWDWMPTIRGRNTGIWGPVELWSSSAVTLEEPFVTSKLPLPDVSRADVRVAVNVVNHSGAVVKGNARGRVGDVPFERALTLQANSAQRVDFDVTLQQPKLWWPAGYGEPHLYDVLVEFEEEGRGRSDFLHTRAGIRQLTYNEDGAALRIFINGRRLVPKGGNWGFSESMLRYRAREYDAAARYHREMNFNIVRNWVGQIGDDAFYEACDRHGLLVWQDFWLANPGDGPEPDNDALFLANARDVVTRIRSHACVGLYCGRNEGYPPAPIEKGLRDLLAELHPEIHYIPSSADGVVSGRGPYNALSSEDYFRTEDTKFHSEIGAPAIPSFESVQAMMPESSLWPQARDWGLHDFCLHGAQGGLSFQALIENAYGGADNAKDWIALAQFINYDTYRAMFEAQGQHRMGVLLWMSHPCWPSFVWQTYDYYLEPSSAYFGCRKAAESLHIQWNSATDKVEVVNASAGSHTGLKAKAEIFDPNGKSLSRQEAPVDSAEDSVGSPIALRYPEGLSEVHMLRLTLSKGSEALSVNTYLRGVEAGNFRAIRAWGRSQVTATTETREDKETWKMTTTLRNTSQWPALMVRQKVVREHTGDRILPVIYSDNYLTLLPGESATVTSEVARLDTRGERPKVVVERFR